MALSTNQISSCWISARTRTIPGCHDAEDGIPHRTHPDCLLTARTWDLDKARQIRPDGYVVKPYQPAELLEMVGRLTASWDHSGSRPLPC
jgi:hypothetical protein